MGRKFNESPVSLDNSSDHSFNCNIIDPKENSSLSFSAGYFHFSSGDGCLHHCSTIFRCEHFNFIQREIPGPGSQFQCYLYRSTSGWNDLSHCMRLDYFDIFLFP
ncbi:MAG: PAN domain-containing protein [Anaerolineaceae bacterium]